MEINLLAFGQIADITGKTGWTMSGIHDTEQLQTALAEAYRDMAGVAYSVAVNKTIVREKTTLQPGDTIALLPPFSGG